MDLDYIIESINSFEKENGFMFLNDNSKNKTNLNISYSKRGIKSDLKFMTIEQVYGTRFHSLKTSLINTFEKVIEHVNYSLDFLKKSQACEIPENWTKEDVLKNSNSIKISLKDLSKQKVFLEKLLIIIKN